VDSLTLSIGALVLVGAALGLWMWWIRRVALAGRRWIAYALLGAGMLLAAASLGSDPGLASGAIAGLALAVGVAWIVLGVLAPQSRQAPAIAVGEPLPGFTAPDENGAPFRVEALRGRPVLIKLFRGHW
jgi:hypothetical protein